MDASKTEQARVTSYGAGQAQFTGLTCDEVNHMLAASNGTVWVRVNDAGRVERHDAFAPLPQPTDEKMEPFWRKNQNVQASLKLDDFEPLPVWPDPSITIQHLCGYGYTPELYAATAANLERWGFDCLRSKRGKEGRFWELWYLPGFWRAKEELKDAITKAGNDMADQRKAAISFLAKNSSFGSMDMSHQKLAMVID